MGQANSRPQISINDELKSLCIKQRKKEKTFLAKTAEEMKVSFTKIKVVSSWKGFSHELEAFEICG